MLAGLMTGARQTPAWNLPAETMVDYYDLKGVMENLLTGLLINDLAFRPAPVVFLRHGTAIFSGDTHLGYLGEIHPEVAERFELKQPAWDFLNQFRLDGGGRPGICRFSDRFPSTPPCSGTWQ